MPRPNWTDVNGRPIPPERMTEYAPGRWTAMIVNPDELAARKRELAAAAAAFEREIERDFGRQYECIACGDSRFVSVNGAAEPCRRCSLTTTVGRTGPSDFARAGIPEGYLRDCTISSFDGDSLRSLAREWVSAWAPQKPFLFFLGDRGNGKTHLSVAILRELWEQKRQWGKFCQVSEMLNAIRASYDPDSDATADGILSPYKMAPLLVLDDIGVGKQTPWVDEQLWLLVSYRYTRGLPTIASANPDGLDKTEPRVKERLMDVQTGVTWRFAGKNRRVA